MKHISILVPNGDNNLSSIIGSYKILKRANQLWKQSHQKEVFKIELVGLKKQVKFHDEHFSVNPDQNIKDIHQTDLIIIPSLNHQYHLALKENKALIPWIQQHYKEGATVASICTGAFLLAATGLLDHKSCSTHWAAADELRTYFPNIHLEPDLLITEEHGIITNGGAFSFLNLMLYLIEKYFDRPTAILCSKIFQIEFDRNAQANFSIFNGNKKHEDQAILKAQKILEEKYLEKFSMDTVAEKLNLERRTFDRRFNKATGFTPLEYLQRVKMEVAKRQLESSRKGIQEVMLESGYLDEKAFREVFHKITGMTPIEYKQRYNRSL